MLNAERYATYDTGWPDAHAMPHLTLNQVKRARRKRFSRKTHAHEYLMTLEGRRKITWDGKPWHCPLCRSAPWREPVAVKAAPGPRDWKPGAGA